MDILSHFHKCGEMSAPLQLYDSVVTRVFQAFALAVKVTLRRAKSGRLLRLNEFVPVVICEEDVNKVSSSLYSCLYKTDRVLPPSILIATSDYIH